MNNKEAKQEVKTKEQCYQDATLINLAIVDGTRMDIIYDAMELYASQFKGAEEAVQPSPDALEILKSIGYDNNSITSTELWIASELYKKFSSHFSPEPENKSNVEDLLLERKGELFRDHEARIKALLKNDPIAFFRVNILRHCNPDQMRILCEWLQSYECQPKNNVVEDKRVGELKGCYKVLTTEDEKLFAILRGEDKQDVEELAARRYPFGLSTVTNVEQGINRLAFIEGYKAASSPKSARKHSSPVIKELLNEIEVSREENDSKWKGLTDEDKIMAVANTPEMSKAIALLTAVFVDLNLKTHIRYEYHIPELDEGFEFTFLKLRKKSSSNPVEVKEEKHIVNAEDIKRWYQLLVGTGEEAALHNYYDTVTERKEDEGREEPFAYSGSKPLTKYEAAIEAGRWYKEQADKLQSQLTSEREWSAKLYKMLDKLHFLAGDHVSDPVKKEITTLLNEYNQYKSKK